MCSFRNFSKVSDSSGSMPSILRAIVGLTNSDGFPVTGCRVTSGCVVDTASRSARSAPSRATSPTDAEVWCRLRGARMAWKVGDRASYAAVRLVKAVSPPPDAGVSRTQKKVVEGRLGVKVWSMCQRS